MCTTRMPAAPAPIAAPPPPPAPTALILKPSRARQKSSSSLDDVLSSLRIPMIPTTGATAGGN